MLGDRQIEYPEFVILEFDGLQAFKEIVASVSEGVGVVDKNIGVVQEGDYISNEGLLVILASYSTIFECDWVMIWLKVCLRAWMSSWVSIISK